MSRTDFISSLFIKFRRRKVTAAAVTVSDYKSMLVRRTFLNGHSYFSQHFNIKSYKSYVITDVCNCNIDWNSILLIQSWQLIILFIELSSGTFNYCICSVDFSSGINITNVSENMYNLLSE